jgi:hypothetical protein
MKTEKRIFASLLGMEEQTKEERLQWAEDNGMVWSVDWFITSVNCGMMVDINKYQFDSYEAELNNSMVSVNIVQLASELAENQTKIEMFDNDCLDEEEEEQMYVSHSDGTTSFTEEAQDIFNPLYDYYYNVILKCQ